MKITALVMKKTKAGDDYKLFTMEDSHKLSVFNWDLRYPELNVGSDIPEDALIFDPAYSNYKLKPLPKPSGAAIKTPGGYRNPAAIEKAQETKRENVEEAQNRKQDGIKLAGAMRDATLVALADIKDQPFPSDDDFKRTWMKWCDFFLEQHDVLKDRPF